MKKTILVLSLLCSVSAFAQNDPGVYIGDRFLLNDITLQYDQKLNSSIAIFNDGKQVPLGTSLIAQSECRVSVLSVGTKIGNKLKNLETTVTGVDVKRSRSQMVIDLKIHAVNGAPAKGAFAQIHCALGAGFRSADIDMNNVIYNIGASRISADCWKLLESIELSFIATQKCGSDYGARVKELMNEPDLYQRQNQQQQNQQNYQNCYQKMMTWRMLRMKQYVCSCAGR